MGYINEFRANYSVANVTFDEDLADFALHIAYRCDMFLFDEERLTNAVSDYTIVYAASGVDGQFFDGITGLRDHMGAESANWNATS